VAAAAVSRQKSAAGSTYRGQNLASLWGSPELEYGADDCCPLVPDADVLGAVIQCEKNHYRPTDEFRTVFDGMLQAFSADDRSAGDRFDAASPAQPDCKRAKG
jgi:hypothetical protein